MTANQHAHACADAPQTAAQAPTGINHLVLNVRDIDESHRFWTALLGFRHVGTSRRARPDGLPPMRFYSGEREGKLHHHDIALYQPASKETPDGALPQTLDHVAIEYPSEHAWREQIRFLRSRGVALRALIERGTTHSIHLTDPNGVEVELVFELPRSDWEDDIDGALNRAVPKSLET
jgi:catechol 2,3-dioxygenase